MIELKDWKVVLGWDASKVKTGLKSLDTMMKRVEKTNDRIEEKKKRDIERAYKQRDLLQKKQDINFTKAERQREMAQRKIITAERQAYVEAERLQRKKSEATSREARQKEAIANKERRRQLSEIEFINRRNRMISNLRDIESRVNANQRRGVFSSDQASGLRGAVGLGINAIGGATNSIELAKMQGVYNGIVASTRTATRAASAHAAEIRKANFAANSLSGSIKNMASSWLSIFAAFEGASAFYRVGVAFDSMRATSLAAAGDSKTAAENMDFLVKSSDRLGTNLQAGVMGFNKLSIAARAAGYDNKTIRDIFTGTSESITAYQLNDEQQKNIFYSLSQMASKTRISTEELQRQMGDYLPSAMPAMVKAYSEFSGKEVNAGQLIELISAGKVLSKDVLPGFAKHLGLLAREGGALEAAMKKVATEQKRFNNEVQKNVDAGFTDAQGEFAMGWRELTAAMKQLKPVFKVFGNVFGATFAAVATVIRVVSPLLGMLATAFTNVFKIFTDRGKTASDALKKNAEQLTIWDRVALATASAAYAVAAGIYYFIAALEFLNEALVIKEGDSPLAKFAKSLTSIGIAAIAMAVIWRKAFSPLISRLVKITGLARGAAAAMGLVTGATTAGATTGAAAAGTGVLAGVSAAALGGVAAGGASAYGTYQMEKDNPALAQLIKTLGATSPLIPLLAGGLYGGYSMMGGGKTINVEVTNQFNGASQADAAKASASIVKTVQDQLAMENL